LVSALDGAKQLKFWQSGNNLAQAIFSKDEDSRGSLRHEDGIQEERKRLLAVMESKKANKLAKRNAQITERLIGIRKMQAVAEKLPHARNQAERQVAEDLVVSKRRLLLGL
jgi:hypothetical protein